MYIFSGVYFIKYLTNNRHIYLFGGADMALKNRDDLPQVGERLFFLMERYSKSFLYPLQQNGSFYHKLVKRDS